MQPTAPERRHLSSQEAVVGGAVAALEERPATWPACISMWRRCVRCLVLSGFHFSALSFLAHLCSPANCPGRFRLSSRRALVAVCAFSASFREDNQ